MDYIDLQYDEKSHPKTQYPQLLIDYLCECFLPSGGGKVLEVGCGRGDFINAFLSNRYQCFAVDIESRPKGLHSDIEFATVNMETENLPYENDYFDVVFSKSVIEHIQNYNRFVEECRRVLKPGSVFIVMTPDWLTCHRIFYCDYTHIKPYTSESLGKLLSLHKMQLIQCAPFVQWPSVWCSPLLRGICRCLQFFGPVRKHRTKTSFLRWSRELILLAVARK